MTRPLPSLSALGSVAIAATVLFGSTAAGMACPWRQSAFTQSATVPPRAGDAATRADVTTAVKPQSGQNLLELHQAGLYGLGALAGLVAMGLVYRVHYSRRAAALTDETWLNHPELVHPELFLTAIPKEALFSSIADRGIALMR